MGETPRKAPNQLNYWARSSDVRSLLKGCPAEWALTLLAHDEQKRDNINFALGTAFHVIPEEVLAGGMTLDSAIAHSIDVLEQEIGEFDGDSPIRGKRSLNPTTLAKNLDRMGRNWWKDYQASIFPNWEVAVEYTVTLGTSLRTQLDALFSHPNINEYAIVDWKSGMSSKSDSMQLHIYEYGLRKNGTIEPDAQVDGWFYHAWNGDWQKADRYPGDAVVAEWLEETRQRKLVGMRYDQGSACGFTPIPDWYCNYCAVQDSLCPVFNDGKWEAVDALWEERQPVLVEMNGEHIGYD